MVDKYVSVQCKILYLFFNVYNKKLGKHTDKNGQKKSNTYAIQGPRTADGQLNPASPSERQACFSIGHQQEDKNDPPLREELLSEVARVLCYPPPPEPSHISPDRFNGRSQPFKTNQAGKRRLRCD